MNTVTRNELALSTDNSRVTTKPSLVVAQMPAHSLKLSILVALEFVVAGIMFVGGTLLTIMTADKPLGIVHAVLGFLGFPVGYGLWAGRSWAWNSALALNVASIAYSTFSEVLVINGPLLPPGALEGSIGGTIVAILISSLILYQLTRRGVNALLPNRTVASLVVGRQSLNVTRSNASDQEVDVLFTTAFMRLLEGKVAVITDASGGIGSALARFFADSSTVT